MGWQCCQIFNIKISHQKTPRAVPEGHLPWSRQGWPALRPLRAEQGQEELSTARRSPSQAVHSLGNTEQHATLHLLRSPGSAHPGRLEAASTLPAASALFLARLQCSCPHSSRLRLSAASSLIDSSLAKGDDLPPPLSCQGLVLSHLCQKWVIPGSAKAASASQALLSHKPHPRTLEVSCFVPI